MKKIWAIMIAAATVLHSAGQSKVLAIPPPVNKAFLSQFPNAHLKNWQEKDGSYMATFRQSRKKYIAYYTSGGVWEATESSIKWTRNLPAAVRKSWDTCKYRTWLLLDIKKIDKPGLSCYTLHVGEMQSLGPDDADIGSEYILFFSDNGQLMKEERQP